MFARREGMVRCWMREPRAHFLREVGSGQGRGMVSIVDEDMVRCLIV